MVCGSQINFVKVTTEDISMMISSAKERIFFAKPAFFKAEIEELLCVIKTRNIRCDLFFEDGDQAIRNGFGDALALGLINNNIRLFNLHFADKVRIAILIIDDNALIYMPDLLFMEEKETKELTFPNGLSLDKDMTQNILKQFSNDNKTADTNNIVCLPRGYIQKDPDDNEEVQQQKIKNSINTLKENPAVDVLRLKKISFYRNNYKIMKMEIRGVKIENKKINLKPFYNLIPNINKKLISSWNILDKSNISELQDTINFQKALVELINSFKGFLIEAGRFGYIINIKKKADFTKEINQLKEDFKAYLRNNKHREAKQRFAQYESEQEKKRNLIELLDESRQELVEHLYNNCPKDDKEFINSIFGFNRQLKKKYDESNNKKPVLRELIDFIVMDKLKFTDADDIINKIDIILDFYDVSDELIFENEDFRKLIDKYNLELRHVSDGYTQQT